MSDQNSTQISNLKGETNIRRASIGGDFAFFDEEKEPELGDILEKCMSAIGGLPTPDFKPILSSIFGKDTWTAITDLGTQLIGSEAFKNLPKPDEERKMEDGLALRQALEVIENARISNTQQEKHKFDDTAERILGRIISQEEANIKLKRNTAYTGGRSNLSLYELVEVRAAETKETEMAKGVEQQQKQASIAKGADFNLDKVNEGGSILSTTGGAGAG